MARVRTDAEVGRIWSRGVGAGFMAAIVMGLVAMVVSGFRGMGFWIPMELIGATYLGVDYPATPVWAIVFGVLTHLAIGGGYGVLFAAITQNIRSLGTNLAIGLMYGAGVFLFMTYLIMPWLDPIMFVHVDKGLFFLYHLVYGLMLGLVPARRVTKARRRREAY